MTTLINRISLPTRDTAPAFPEPAVRRSGGENERFKDSLDRNVRPDTGARDEKRAGSDEPVRRERGARTDAQEPRDGARIDGDSRDTAERDAAPKPTVTTESGETRERVEGDAETIPTDENAGVTAELDVIFTIGNTTKNAEQEKTTIASPVVDGESESLLNKAEVPRAGLAEPQQNKNAAAVGVASDADGATVFADDSAATEIVDAADAATVSVAPSAVPRTGERATGQAAASDATGTNTAAPVAVAGAGGGEGASADSDASSSQRDSGAIFRLVSEDAGTPQRVDSGQAFQVEAASSPAGRETNNEAPRASVLKVTGTDAEVTPANERAVTASVSRGLAAAVQQRGGSLTIRLSPESLGHVRVELEMSQGRVTAALHASTEQAQEAMSRSITMLRSSLESKGLTVDRLTVQLTPSTTTNQAGGNDASGQDTSRQSAEQDRDASGGESRGSRDGGGSEQHGQKRAFDERFDELFGLEPGDPRTRSIRLGLSAIG